jgi:hypothetical protein
MVMQKSFLSRVGLYLEFIVSAVEIGHKTNISGLRNKCSLNVVLL